MTKSADEVQFFLVHLEKDKFEQFFVSLLFAGISIEMFDPRELGQKWQTITFLNSESYKEPNHEYKEKMMHLEKTIQYYSPIYSFEEKFESGDVNLILENWQEKYLFDAVQKLNNKSIINKKFLQQKSILKKVKNKWQVTIIKDLKALYTKYEITSKLPLIYNKLFKLEDSSEVVFACFAVLNKDAQNTKESLSELQMDNELISWNKEIVASNLEKSIVYNFPVLTTGKKWSKFLIFIYYFLCSFVIHDIFVGLVILFSSLFGYNFELKNKTFITQIWTGIGSIVFGIIGGSFAGNLLSVLSMSKYLVVKEIGNGLLWFLALFQVIDWTNQNQNPPLNYNLASQNFSPIGIFTITFIALSLIIISSGQLIKTIDDYQNTNLKNAIVRTIFTVNTIILILYASNLVPIWAALLSLFLLLIYQPDLQIGAKIKTFFVGDFGLFGFLKMLIRSLWLWAIFGVLILSTLVYNNINLAIGDNLIILLLADTITGLILWQLAAFLVAKALKVNTVDQLLESNKHPQTRLFNPITKYKYWKF
jgi:hypothetical protein